MAEDVPIHAAATTICLRDGEHGVEALLVRRASKLAFYGGAWVFPGGRVDPDDAAQGFSSDGSTTKDLCSQAAARMAATREANEEARIILDPTALQPLSHWTTPPGNPRRFATWFFVAAAPSDTAVEVDAQEIEHHAWLTPGAALNARDEGRIRLPPPTFVTLTWAKRFTTVSEALRDAESQAPRRYVPKPFAQPTGAVSLYQGDAGYEIGDPNAHGRRHRLWMLDSGWRYERDKH